MENIQNKSGVYCFRNKHNNKIYIGSSKNIKERHANHKSRFKLKKAGDNIMDRVYRKYDLEDFEFQVLFYTEDYLEWENLLIKLLDPEYNSSKMIGLKIRPNLGKKFNQEWIDKLGKCKEHSKETLEKLIHLNKQNACKIQFSKNSKVLIFNSWREAAKYFKKKSNSFITKNRNTWRGWEIIVLKKQKKKVQLIFEENILEFNSASSVDKFLNLWRGATSNAIRNNNGNLHNYKVKYL